MYVAQPLAKSIYQRLLFGVVELLQGARQDLMHCPPDNVAVLDVLRSLAILLVFGKHFAVEFRASAGISKFPMVHWGWSGVDLFFILSGFLIGKQLWKELASTGQIRIARFLLRRGLRIWPLYFSFIALLSGEVLFFGHSAKGLLADALFLSNYFQHQLGGGWSLSTEEQFYVIAPVCVSLLALKLKPKRLWILPLSALWIPIIARAVHIASSSALNPHDLHDSLYFAIHTHADGLAMGLFLAWLAVFHSALFHSARFRLGAALAMGCLAIALYVFNPFLFDFTAWALIYGAAALYGMGLSAVPKVLRWHGFYVISRLSYGIYLNHFFVLPQLYAILGKWRLSGGDPAYWVCYVISFFVCLAFAAATFHLIEWPFLVIRARFLSPRTDDKSPAAVPQSLRVAGASAVSSNFTGI
jgi:peptidoglycan/LPS O-acetylase OafA/YrhL